MLTLLDQNIDTTFVVADKKKKFKILTFHYL